MKKHLQRLLLLMTLLVVPWVTQGQTTLTVNDGTQTNDYVPIYGYMADNVTRSQFVIPASDLTDVVNNLISKLTFYSGTASKDWGGSWKVYLKEISSTTLTAYQDWSSLTEVYSGSLSIAGNQMVVEFQDGFLYLGGNLLVGVYQVSSGNWLSSVHWQGVTASSGASLYSYGSSSGSAQSFLPKMTIEYAMPPSCIKPGNITTSNVTASSADVTWVAGGTETSWQYLYGTTGFTPDWSDATLVSTTSASLTGLSVNTEYDLYVRSYCSESDQSDPVKKSFRTDCDVIADADLPYFYSDYYSYAALPKFASDINKLQLNFKMYVSTASYPIEVGVMTDPSDYSTFTRFGEAILAGSTSTWVDKEVFFDTYTGPDGYIAFRCPETGSYSVYIDNVSVSKIPSCKPVQSVSVNNIERVAFDVTWTPKSGVTNCEGYEVVVSDTELDATALESATKHMVTDGSNTYHATGLTRNTTYYVYVRSNCGATDGVSEWLSTSVTTAALSGVDEVQIGNETLTTSYQFPFSAYYHNSYTQQVYAKNELNHESGAISSLSFNYFWATSTTRYVTIYMANVPEGSNVSSNWISSGLTEVYSGKATTFSSTDGWCTIQLDDAFEYTGGDVLVAMYMQYNSCETQYSSNNRFYYSNGGFGRYATNDNSSASGLSLNSDNVPSTSGSSVTYRPNIRFGFPFGIDPCPAVETVSYELTGEGTTTATVSWTASAGDYANTYDVYYSTTEVTDFSGVTPQFTGVTALSQALTGLSPYTDYYVYVMCHCDGEGQNDGISTWNGVQFKTNSVCRVVTDLDVVPASKYTATATWTGTTQANNFQYVLSTTELTDAEVEAATPTAAGLTEATATLTGLVPEQTYYLYVANNCTGEGLSPYVGTSFTMPEACAEPANLAIADLGKYSFTATWNADTYADATDTYDMIVSDTELDDAALASATITYAGIADTSKTVELLQRGTTYYVYVRCNCSVAENGTTDWVSISATTLDMEPDCDNTVDVQIGEGTSSAYLLYTAFGNTYSQHIYTAEELHALGYEAGTINSVSFRFTSTSSYAKDQSVYIGTTELSAFAGSGANDFISGLTRVYGPTNNTLSSSGWRTYTFDQPFEWDGVSNIVVGMLSNKQGAGSSIGWSAAGTDGSAYRTICRYRDTSPIDIDNLSAVSYSNSSSTRPNIKFAFCAPAEACPTVDAPVASNVEVTTATLTWNEGEGDFASSYDVLVSDEEITDFSAVVPTDSNLDTTTYDATGLTGNTTYYAYVRVNCVNENYNDGSSTWSPAGEFTTELPCRRPTDFADTRVYAHAVDLTWVNVNNATAWQVGVVGATDTTWQDVVNPVVSNDTVSYQFTGLDADSAYHFLLRANCSASGDGFSGICFDEVNITTIDDANAITAFSFSPNYPAGFQMEDAVIDTANHTINVTVLSGTDLTTLEPYVFSTNSQAYNPYKINGAFYNYGAIDFSSPVVVTVYAEDTTLTQDWTITVLHEACATPASLTISNVERRKMTLNWTLGDTTATNFDLVVSETEITDLTTDTPQSITAVGNAGSYSYTIDSLFRNTQYYIYLRTNCGAEQSHWASASQKTPDICNELQVTVANGTITNSYVPIYGNYCDDANVKSQSIYPESMLTELVGKPISSMKYFVSSGSSTGKWDNVDFTVKMGTTTATSLASGYVSDANQTVYVGHVSANTTNGMVIDFDTPFLYTGGNLVIEFSKTVATGYSSCYFYGIPATNASYNTNSSSVSAGVKDFLPKVQFTSSVCDEACPAVDTAYAELTGEGMNTATVHWTESTGDYANTYDVIYSETEITDFTGLTPDYAAVNGLSQELFGLDAYTIYYVYVRANCDGEGQNDGSSTWYGFNFRTNAACHVPHDLAAELTNTNAVEVTWTNDQDNNFRYILSTTPVALENLEATAKTGENLNATSLTVDNLDYETEYHFYLSNACGGSDGNSPWDSVSFTTLPQCTAVVGLMASDTAANSVRLTWTNGQFCNATSWQVTATDATDNVVYDRVATDTTTLVFGLTPETAYTLAVRAICGTGDTAAATTATITTTVAPSACVTVADGTAVSYYAPVYSLYCDEKNRVQSLYPASMLAELQGRTINSVKFFVSSQNTPSNAGKWDNSTFYVKMATTSQENLSSAWVTDAATTVYTGTLQTSAANGMEVVFDTPFEYDGGNLMIEFEQPNASGYTATYFYGQSVDGGARYAYGSSYATASGTATSFLPKAQFCFAASGCNKVSNLVAENVTVNSADISWTPGGSETSWNVYNSATELDADALAALTATDYTTVDYPAQALSGLNVDADYYCYVQANCSATETSDWKVCPFVTLPSCSAPLTAVASNDAPDTLTFVVSAGQYGTAESYNYEYWAVGDSVNGDTISVSGADTLSVAVAAFNTYGWRVQANCGTTDGLSRWTNGNEVYVCGRATLPYSESFETIPTSYSGPGMIESICWNDLNASASSSDYPCYVGTTAFATDGSQTLMFRSSNVTPIYTILPVIKDATECQVKFDCTYENLTNSGRFQIGYMTDPTDESTFVPAFTDSPTVSQVMQSHTVNIFNIPEGARIAIKYTAGLQNNYYGWIDNIRIDTIPYYTVVTAVAPEVTPAIGSVEIACAATDTTATGKFYENTTPQFTAVPATGMFFVNWTNANNGDTLATVNPWTLTVDKDSSFVANFDTIAYDLNVTVNEATNFGTVSGSGTFKYLTSHQIEATPNEHYHFVAWNDDNTDNPRTITIDTMDTAFVANFAIDTHQLALSVMPVDVMGSVADVNGYYNYGDSVNISATANYGYFFTGWSDNVTDNERRIAILNDTAIAAQFDSLSYTITAQTADAVMGAVTGTATQKYLTTVTIEATPEYGYHFVAWNDGNTTNPRTVTVERDSLFTASFDSNIYTVTILADLDEEMQPKGDVTGSGEYKYLSQVDISVEQRLGFYFMNWSDGDVNAHRTITVTSDTTITAMFSIQPVWTVATSCDTVMGTVTPLQNILDSLNATIEATNKYGYHFVSWNDGVTDNPRTLQVVSDTAFTAVFDYNQYTIDVAAANSVMGSVTGTATKNYLQLDTIEATANYGYHFVAWNDGVTDNPRIVTVERDSLFTASFDNNTYTVTVQHDTVMGTIENTGEYRYLDNVVLTAVPNVGYHLDHWDNGSEEATRSFVITCDTTFVFTFAPNVYALTVAADNDVKGTVSGNGNYNYNTNVSIAAVANYGYEFNSWNDGNTENPREVNIVSDSSFTALFDTVDFTVTALAAVSTMGTVAGSGDYAYNTTATLTATANYGYHFTQWTDGNTDNPRTVSVVANATYTAEFAVDNYTLTVNGDAVMGNVAGAGSYAYNSNAQISATANYGYHFTQWNDGNTDNPRTVVVTENATYTAQFAANNYNVAVVSDNSLMGSVAGAGSYTYNTNATLTATANYGYSFAQWSDGNTSNPRIVTVTRDSSFTAQFAANSYNVTVVSANTTMGSVAGSDSYTYNTNAQISATANYGYHFTQWNDGNTDNPRTVVVTENATYTAQFAANTYQVTALSDNNIMGTVSGTNEYTYNTNATLTATANYGYHFTQWTDGNTDNPRTVVVTENATYTAEFAANTYTLTVNGDAVMGNATGSGSYSYGETVMISATANYGYHFTQWNDGNTDNPRTVLVNDNITLTAQFANNGYQVTTAVTSEAGSGSITGAGSYEYGATVTLTATATPCYHFVAWNDGLTEPTRTETVTSDLNFTAEFALNVYGSSFSEVACDSYEWAGITYTESIVEERVFQTANGCDSTVTMTLTVNYSDHITLDLVESGSYTWNDVTYDQSGVYVQNFTNANNCDSIVTINLTVYGTAAPEIVDFAGVGLMVNHYPNGSAEYVDYADYRWYRDGQLVASGSDTYMEGNGKLNGCYYVEIPTDASKTIWDRSNELCFRNGVLVGIEEAEGLEVSLTVAPNPVRSGAMITITTDLPAERLHGAILVIYDLNGREVNRVSMEQQSVRFNAEQTSGTYTVVLTTEDGVRIVKRVVVR